MVLPCRAIEKEKIACPKCTKFLTLKTFQYKHAKTCKPLEARILTRILAAQAIHETHSGTIAGSANSQPSPDSDENVGGTRQNARQTQNDENYAIRGGGTQQSTRETQHGYNVMKNSTDKAEGTRQGTGETQNGYNDMQNSTRIGWGTRQGTGETQNGYNDKQNSTRIGGGTRQGAGDTQNEYNDTQSSEIIAGRTRQGTGDTENVYNDVRHARNLAGGAAESTRPAEKHQSRSERTPRLTLEAHNEIRKYEKTREIALKRQSPDEGTLENTEEESEHQEVDARTSERTQRGTFLQRGTITRTPVTLQRRDLGFLIANMFHR